MRSRLAIIFVAIVLVPLGLLAGLGQRMVRSEQELVRRQFEKLQADRLGDVEVQIRDTLGEIERALLKSTANVALEPEALRELASKEPLFRQTFAVAASGVLIHPSPQGALTNLSQSERDFLRRTEAIWTRQAVLYELPGSETASVASHAVHASSSSGGGDSILDLARTANQGWIAWYWEEGVHFLFWRRHASGAVVGGEVERIALLSRLVGKLPSGESERGRAVLVDARGETVHQWGALAAGSGPPLVARVLGAPLDSLRLEYFPAPEDLRAFSGEGTRFNIFAGLAAVGLTLLGLATYFYREYTRDLREAARRVSFVTQVSHELKTPLTNIRLYAELLMERLQDDENRPEGADEQLTVIVSESQRLTRLINNILTFSKQRRGALTLERAPTDVDDVIATVLGQFGPSLQAKGLVADFQRGAQQPVLVDKDALGQIIANLISNVEKYASSGGHISIESAQQHGATIVTVSDRGPGIPPEHRGRIFEPFYRVSDRLSDGVAGTGIGLTIARDLARLHGGDLVLASSDVGARFQIIL